MGAPARTHIPWPTPSEADNIGILRVCKVDMDQFRYHRHLWGTELHLFSANRIEVVGSEGKSIAPAERMISLLAESSYSSPAVTTETPLATLSASKMIFLARVC